MPVWGWLVSCVWLCYPTSSILPFSVVPTSLSRILCKCLWSGKKCFACNKWKLLSKNSFWDPTKTVFESQTGARGGKKCSPVKIENVVPYTWLLLLLNLRACWILDNADPGYCRGATDFSWQSIHTLARDHRECGRQYPVTSTGYLHSCSSLGPYFRVEWKVGTVF